MAAPSSFFSGAYAPISSFQATSTDSTVIGTGAKTFNTQSGKTFRAGDYVLVFSAANNANFMSGQISSYTGSVLVMNVTATGGSGTYADWNIDLAGSPGSTGATGATGAAGTNGTNGAGFIASSTTSLANAATGSKGFVLTQAAATIAWTAGGRIRATSAGTGHWMEGVISTFNSGTDTLTITADKSDGDTGTYADWNINAAGQPGASGAGVTNGLAHQVPLYSAPATISSGITLTDGQLIVGKTGLDPIAATVGGDLTCDNTGAFTIGNVKVTVGKMSASATNRIFGRITAGAGAGEELTGANVVTIIGGNLAVLQGTNTWKIYYNDGSSVAQPLALGASGTFLAGNGVSAAPSFVSWATAGQYQGNSSDVLLHTNAVWTAAALTTLTDAATVAVDLATGLNFTVTLAGNRTLGNPTNTKAGQSGVIEIIQDGTGTRTLSYASNWKFIGGQAPTLTTTASARDYLTYFVVDSTHINASLMRAVA